MLLARWQVIDVVVDSTCHGCVASAFGAGDLEISSKQVGSVFFFARARVLQRSHAARSVQAQPVISRES